jgi:hypothetical protein
VILRLYLDENCPYFTKKTAYVVVCYFRLSLLFFLLFLALIMLILSRSRRSHTAAMSNSLARATGQGRKPPPPRPLPQDIVDNGYRYSLAQRIQCLALITEHFSAAAIERKTGVKQRTQSNIKKKAFERGFRLDIHPGD